MFSNGTTDMDQDLDWGCHFFPATAEITVACALFLKVARNGHIQGHKADIGIISFKLPWHLSVVCIPVLILKYYSNSDLVECSRSCYLS